MAGKPWTEEQKEAARLARLARSGDLIGDEEVPPEEAEPEAAEIVEPSPDPLAELRARYLSGLAPEIAELINDDELKKIIAEEEEKARNEKKKRALQAIRNQAQLEARVDNDLIPADQIRSEAEKRFLSQPVTFRVNMPKDVADSRGFRIDGFLYENNQVYTRPRHVFQSLLEMHYRVHVNNIEFRTLDQAKMVRSRYMQPARIILSQSPPPFEVIANA